MSNQAVAVAGTIYWGFFNKPNDLSNKYQVDICCLSDKAVEAIEAMGVEVRNKGDDRGSFITVKSNNPIRVNFAADVGDADVEMIGNGTKAKAAIGYYDWNFRNKKGRSPSLMKLVVTDLVTYAGKEGSGGGIDLDNVI